ncbi:hypothetical protein Tco_1007578 [Tanacetum coccineum]
MSKDNRLLMEIESVGLCPELMVGALFSNTLVGSRHGSKQSNVVQKVDDDIYGLISDLEISIMNRIVAAFACRFKFLTSF